MSPAPRHIILFLTASAVLSSLNLLSCNSSKSRPVALECNTGESKDTNGKCIKGSTAPAASSGGLGGGGGLGGAAPADGAQGYLGGSQYPGSTVDPMGGQQLDEFGDPIGGQQFGGQQLDEFGDPIGGQQFGGQQFQQQQYIDPFANQFNNPFQTFNQMGQPLQYDPFNQQSQQQQFDQFDQFGQPFNPQLTGNNQLLNSLNDPDPFGFTPSPNSQLATNMPMPTAIPTFNPSDFTPTQPSSSPAPLPPATFASDAPSNAAKGPPTVLLYLSSEGGDLKPYIAMSHIEEVADVVIAQLAEQLSTEAIPQTDGSLKLGKLTIKVMVSFKFRKKECVVGPLALVLTREPTTVTPKCEGG